MKTQWTDYMEDVISIITIGSEQAGQPPRRRILTQASSPFCILNVPLSQGNTRRIHHHNSGLGTVATEPLHLWPYALVALICGFN
eukprot:725487-Ditylum_brightwellii.AAC.1